jgi:hypothetical protein
MTPEEKAAVFCILKHAPETPGLFNAQMMAFDERALMLPVHRFGNSVRIFYHVGQDDKQINATWDEYETALRRFEREARK